MVRLATLAAALTALAVWTGTAQAITVGTTSDGADASPDNGTCEAPCTPREVATGSAKVKRGRYTALVRSAVALSAGTYAYKHVVTTAKPHQRFFMIRRVTVT